MAGPGGLGGGDLAVMLIYYKLSGINAVLALIAEYDYFDCGAFLFLGATLTLPGLRAII